MYEDRRASGKYNVEELGLGFVRLAGGISFYIEEAWAIHLGGTDGSKIAGSKVGITLEPFAYHTTMSDIEMNATYDIGSADWRSRNLRRRVEVATPVLDPALRGRLDRILDLELHDPRAWRMLPDGTYQVDAGASGPGVQEQLLQAAPELAAR